MCSSADISPVIMQVRESAAPREPRPLAADGTPVVESSSRDPNVRSAFEVMQTVMPAGWCWYVESDGRGGVVCVAEPEPVRLEASTAWELADTITLYMAGVVAAGGIPNGWPEIGSL